uniref:C2H2-type domain-containing protein n=1 Tax=Ditylenchus dipsaci TaxID=166011 RepID=A0A915DYJ7_9BILA
MSAADAQNLEVVAAMNDSQFARTNKRPHQCVICLKSFKSLAYLNEHLAIHRNMKPFVCDVCNKSFRFSTGLNTHRSLHDENNKIYKCVAGNCPLSFRLRGNLKQHMKKEHYKGEGELDAIWNSHPALTRRKRGGPPTGIKKEIKSEAGCQVVIKKEIKSGCKVAVKKEIKAEIRSSANVKNQLERHGQTADAIMPEDDPIEEAFVPPPAETRQYLDLEQVRQIVSPRLGQLLNVGKAPSVVAKQELPPNPYFCEFCSEIVGGKDVVVGHVWKHVSSIKKMCCYECSLNDCVFKTNVQAEARAHRSTAHSPEERSKIVDHRGNLDDFFKNCLRKYFKNLDSNIANELCATRYM